MGNSAEFGGAKSRLILNNSLPLPARLRLAFRRRLWHSFNFVLGIGRPGVPPKAGLPHRRPFLRSMSPLAYRRHSAGRACPAPSFCRAIAGVDHAVVADEDLLPGLFMAMPAAIAHRAFSGAMRNVVAIPSSRRRTCLALIFAVAHGFISLLAALRCVCGAVALMAWFVSLACAEGVIRGYRCRAEQTIASTGGEEHSRTGKGVT